VAAYDLWTFNVRGKGTHGDRATSNC